MTINENRNFILNIMSIAVMIYGIAMIPSLCAAYISGETGVFGAMIIISAICICLGFFGYRYLSNNLTNVKLAICYKTTIFTWLLLIFLSALPYYTAGEGYKMADCIFEATASWTTTGASAILNSELPLALRLWRSSCNWMGGIGIILLTLSFLPNWQFVGQKLVTTEVRGPGFLMSSITFRKAYRRIIFLYVSLTLLQYGLLRAAGMGQLESLLTALSNSSTAGLQHINNGIITALPTACKVIITIFAFLASVNVSALILPVIGKSRELRHNSELNTYGAVILIVTALLTISAKINNPGQSIRSLIGENLMQTIAFTSTAGYTVTDCSSWNSFSLSVIIITMFIGACAISTGGGLKISRLVYAERSLRDTLHTHLHPHSVRTYLYNKQPIEKENMQKSNMYVAMFFILYMFGGILLTIDGTKLFTALSYSQAMLTNVGSHVSNYYENGLISNVSSFSKYIMSLLMLCGRLEIYPVLMLFSAGFWRRENTL